jgi:hypothetical protein
MAWTRASQLDRVLQCPGHLTLPHTRELSERALDAAAYGTMVHRWAETGEVSGTKSHVKTFEKKLAVLETNGVTRETLWPVSGFHEVTFAYNCVDGRLGVCWLKGEEAARAKLAYGDDWITGTADYVYRKDGLCGVDDLKTGMMFDSEPDELSQLYFYLMCWQIYNGIRDDKDGLLSIHHWPKYPLSALPGYEQRVIPGYRIGKFENYIRSLHKKYRAGDAPFVLGAECEYCPAQEACPLLAERS